MMKNTGTQTALAEGNRTGILTSPELAGELIEGAIEATPSSEGGSGDLAEYRSEYIAEGFPIGSLPSLPFAKESQANEEAVGMAVLLDKLSERLAFERMGTRLYETLINKVEVVGESSPGPTLAELQQIRDEELQHFLLLNRSITALGGDPNGIKPLRRCHRRSFAGHSSGCDRPENLCHAVSASDAYGRTDGQ
jgi:hypothetical protein